MARAVFTTEDWWAVWIGLTVFCLSLGTLAGVDLLGWGVATSVWLNLGKAMAPVSKAYGGMPGFVSLLLTYLFMLAVLSTGAWALRLKVRKFAAGFSAIFWITYACWLLGNYAAIAATPDKRKGFGLTWSL